MKVYLKELAIYKEEIDKKRDKLIIDYAEKDGNGEVVKTEDGGIKIADILAFNNDIQKILETDIKISAKDILPLTDILE